MYCLYYQAEIVKEYIGIVTATLRSFEHLCFDRMVKKGQDNVVIFEFFVPPALNNYFTEIMQVMLEKNYIRFVKQYDNRLKYEKF